MRVLQLISPTGFYGAERWILALANQLRTPRLRCDLGVTSESSEAIFELIKRYPKAAGKIHRLELRHRFDTRVVGALGRLLRQEQIDIVHSHGYKSDVLAVLASRRTGTACVSTPHGYSITKSVKDRLYEAIGKRALREFDRVVPLSEGLERAVLAAGVHADRVQMIPNGVDLDPIDAALANTDRSGTGRRSTRGRRLGYVGQLVPRKRVHLILDLFDALWRNDPTTTLDIAGDGSSRAVLEGKAALLPGARSIRFHGFVDDPYELMLGLDLFVMSSHAEGVPRVMMEAMALGLPCAAYSIDGITELIDHDVTGVLAIEGDAPGLVQHCERVLSEPTLADRLGAAARAHIERHHSARSMAAAYRALYEELLVTVR